LDSLLLCKSFGTPRLPEPGICLRFKANTIKSIQGEGTASPEWHTQFKKDFQDEANDAGVMLVLYKRLPAMLVLI
jgi:hypothetical protein